MENYPTHIATLQSRLETVLQDQPLDGVVFHSGELHYYFSDDCNAPLRTNPHFAHWVPLDGPGHAVVSRAGQRPQLIAMIPEDYWYEPVIFDDPFWQSEFDFIQVSTREAVIRELGDVSRMGFIGESTDVAAQAGFAAGSINNELITDRLNWNRSYKTAYEIDCIKKANELGAIAHTAGRVCFENGGSELDIHYAYIQSIHQLDCGLPFESIVALNEKGSFLHYLAKRRNIKGLNLLLDSGATYNKYASDITRTWVTDDADAMFREMRDDLDQLELQLCDMVRPGIPYLEIHESAHRKIAEILSQHGVFTIDPEQAFDLGLSLPFLPCGVGHFLGIQVHDVSGHQVEPDGGKLPPPDPYPFLRTTRTLEPGHVVTIEPGIYFIEMLLRSLRSGPHKDALDWNLIEQLKPHGGIRTEDDILVTDSGNENLTRPFLAE